MNRRFRVKQKPGRSGKLFWGVFDRARRLFYPLGQRRLAEETAYFLKSDPDRAINYNGWPIKKGTP